MSKCRCVDGGRITGGILGPTLRGSESGDLGQGSGILFVKSSLRDSKVQLGPGATVYEIMFAKSSHSDSCTSSHPRPTSQLSVKGTSMLFVVTKKGKEGGERQRNKTP